MLYPSIAELTKNKQSRYSLVIATSKRARKISSDAEQMGIMLSEKAVKIAIGEIQSGKISYREKK
jgi:DNA-directed RNA polymerase subunit omega